MTEDEEEKIREAGRKEMELKLLSRFAELQELQDQEAEINGITLGEIIRKYRLSEEDAQLLKKMIAELHTQMLSQRKRVACLEGMVESLKKMIAALGYHMQ